MATPIYEKLVAQFPTSAKLWKEYVDAHICFQNNDATRHIFSRCLLNCLHVPLWRSYIQFIKKVNENKGVSGLEETRTAFEFTLNNVGEDIASGPLWIDYINLLKSLPGGNTREESQRMSSIRKAYQKAIVTPTSCVEQLWREYGRFESSVNRQLATRLLSEYEERFKSAREVYRERKKYVDDIDWDMLAAIPTGSFKEEVQWVAWKRFLAFEKGNPQRVDTELFKKRVVFTFEQCLMYLYHYPDVWYDYAMWNVKVGNVEAAIKVFERALKVIPDSEMLKYAYAEVEESRGAIKAAKKIYESMVGDGVNATGLAHVQFIRFLRRTEGVEAARKYFIDAIKFENCTYHVYVSYASIAFCLDKDPKFARNVFEAGFKRFMHEPVYTLEYVDFLYCLNDGNNIRALFERALSSLAPETSVEVWERFVQFEQKCGDLASMLKVEQRRKEALAQIGKDGASTLEDPLQDVVWRYSFMDLLPCSTKDLDHLARQDCLAENISEKVEKGPLAITMTNNSTVSAKFDYPNTSQMVIYDPVHKPETRIPTSSMTPGVQAASNTLPNSSTNAFDERLKATAPALLAFMENLPAVEGPTPDVDAVISIFLQSEIPIKQVEKSGSPFTQLSTAPAPSTTDLSNSSKPQGSSFKPYRDRQSRKRKDLDWQEEDETATAQRQPPLQDAFRIRQIQKAQRARVGTTSQSGSTSYSSGRSRDLSCISTC